MSSIRLPENIIECRNLIGGSWIDLRATASQPIASPYNGKIIGRIAASDASEVEQAVSEAQKAFPAWRDTPIKERAQYLFRLRELLLADAEKLSHLIAAESGKTFGEAKAGLLKGIEVLEFATAIQNLDSGGIQQVSRGVSCQYKREPLGVVVGIAPFNFPAMVPLWMYPLALALGNCFILKPSEKVPLSSQAIGQHVLAAGFPPGVFSLVNGDAATVQHLIAHPLTKAIGFVGSTPIAREVYRQASALGKRALTLGGAKNCMILAPDADPNLALEGILGSFTGCAGQRCMAGSVLLAVGAVEPLLEALVKKAQTMQLGSMMGAIINQASLTRLHEAIEMAEREGARIVLDGRKALPPPSCANGFWLGPTIIDQATPEMDCYKRELFGPILTIIRVPNLRTAMEIENLNPFGNATAVFTRSGAVAQFVSDRASTGMIGINIGVPVPREPFSFGGTKDSKFGQGDITGQGGIDFWSSLKKITVKWETASDNNWMS